MPKSLARLALVAGGSSGIGQAIVRRFVADGLRVIFTFCHGEDRAKKIAAETGAEPIFCDLEKAGEAERLAQKIGPVEIFVGSAGIFDDDDGIENVDFLKAWHRVMRVNLDANAELLHGLVPAMAARGWGRVILISSISGRMIMPRESAAYGASKAALDSLARSVSAEFADRGVTANAIAPGPILTPIWDGEEKMCRRAGQKTPLGRPGRPEEIAALAAFLASDEASLVTGQSIAADGGLTTAVYSGA